MFFLDDYETQMNKLNFLTLGSQQVSIMINKAVYNKNYERVEHTLPSKALHGANREIGYDHIDLFPTDTLWDKTRSF